MSRRQAVLSAGTSYVPIQGNKRKNPWKRRVERKREDVKLLCCQVVHDSRVSLTELHLSLFNCAELLTGSRCYGHCSRGGATLLLFGALICG